MQEWDEHWKVHSPREFDLSKPEERERLLRETLGYARVSLDRKDGTDAEGRRLAYVALQQALAMGFELSPRRSEV